MKYVKSQLFFDEENLANQRKLRRLEMDSEKGARMLRGYCVYEKKNREIRNAKETKLKGGRAAVKGNCATCGRPIFLIGREAGRGIGRTERTGNLQRSVKEPTPIQIPEYLTGRDLVALAGGLANLPTEVRYDVDKLKIRPYVIKIGFGIMPKPGQTVEYVSNQTELIPSSKDGKHIRLYDYVPKTARETVAEYNGEVTVTADLKFCIPGVLPWVSGCAGAGASSVYKESIRFTKAYITASTNYCNKVGWEFERMKSTTEDPRGPFECMAILGIPQCFGDSPKQLSRNIAASFWVQAKRSGFLYGPKDEKARVIPIEFD